MIVQYPNHAVLHACKLMAALSAEMEEGRASLLKFIRQCKMRFLHLVGESCVEQRCL